MNFVILDLEWNGTYSRRLKGFMNEIIEFGAVKVDKYYKRRTGQRFAVYAGYEPFSQMDGGRCPYDVGYV